MDTTLSAQKPNISIIVPVYNVEKYLVRCLDSIFCQQFIGTFEVIAVDDGSADSSLHILKIYQSVETRLKIIEHANNKKLSIARVTGMNFSTGDYIMHVDSDDWLLPNALTNLYRTCLETNADVVVFNYTKENPKGKRAFINNIKKKLITTNKLIVQHHFFGAVWNKIVKRALTENMISGQVGVNNQEDLLYASEILLKARNICLIPEYYYAYFENTESLTRVTKPEQVIENQKIILQQIKRITYKYGATSQLTNNILSYLEKDIYLLLSRYGFLIKRGGIQNIELIKAFRLFPEMTNKRLNILSLSMENKFISFILILFKYGARHVFRKMLK